MPPKTAAGGVVKNQRTSQGSGRGGFGKTFSGVLAGGDLTTKTYISNTNPGKTI